jgi:hypothetical protein
VPLDRAYHFLSMFRSGRTIWALVAFLAGFSLLIWVVSDRFLIPAMAAARDATDLQKRQLMATARLLLAVVLMILSVAIILLFQIRRFFFPRQRPEKQKTEYIDAWAESARRMTTPPDDKQDG